MNKFFQFFIILIIVLGLSGCGITFLAWKNVGDSKIFSKEDIEEAMDIVCEEIKKSEKKTCISPKICQTVCDEYIHVYGCANFSF